MIKKESGVLKGYARSTVKFFLLHNMNMEFLVRRGRKDLTVLKYKHFSQCLAPCQELSITRTPEMQNGNIITIILIHMFIPNKLHHLKYTQLLL
jgi:hypothetical protein